jgi:PKD repeat protein
MSLVEVTVAVVIVGVMCVAALRAVSMGRKLQKTTSDRARGEQLAIDLTNEILAQNYQTAIFGLESGKSNANRSQFTDVDDYNGWTESPAQDRSGNALAGTTGFTRSVTVQWADPTTWAATSTANTGLKLITVTVTYNGAKMATITAYRSIAWSDTIPTPTDTTYNHPPVAVATSNKTSGNHPLAVTLSASSSTDPDGDTLNYVWKFGDGTANVSGVSATHTYTTTGTYVPTVTVYDGNGGISTASVQITVN